MNEYFEILLRSVFALAYLFMLAKLMGIKQIAQLTFFDYIIGISIGNIAGALAVDRGLETLYAIIAMSVFSIFAIIISLITRKTIWGRRLLTGDPNIIISRGEIIYKALKRSQFEINDLLRELRVLGYFNIADVEYAILETNGSISVIPKEKKRPLVAEDINAEKIQQGLVSNVIIDGKILYGNLAQMNKDENWLMKELQNQGYKSLENILLGTIDDEHKLSLYIKADNDNARTVFQ